MNERITQLQAIMLTHFEDKKEYSKAQYRTVNEDFWSLADMLSRQWLNNHCDGFDMVNVYDGYCFVVDNKEELKALNMLSESGINNSGFPLWKNWEI